MLGLCAALGGSQLAGPALAYLKRWRGNRMSQGNALLAMLAWSGNPSATQALLSVAGSFRPISLQREAARLAADLAERQGWTVDELADRSVPTAGFGPDGRQLFDVGGRRFTARLTEKLTIQLVNDATGRPVKALPAARAGDDPEQVKAEKARLAATCGSCPRSAGSWPAGRT